MATEQEESFPRGGGKALSAFERKRLRQEAQAEAERDFFDEGGRKKRRSDPAEVVCVVHFDNRPLMCTCMAQYVPLLPNLILTDPKGTAGGPVFRQGGSQG